jgi:hypothetical protein
MIFLRTLRHSVTVGARLAPIVFLFATTASAASPALEQAYRLMYRLDFKAARTELQAWQREHPGDPRGAVSEAATLLFSEFHRLGILEAQFYERNSFILSHPRLTPDPAVRRRFDEAVERAEAMAAARLRENPRDTDALFAQALGHGLRADYAALIEGQNMAALKLTREASDLAAKLLKEAPDYYDAYFATGISQYVVGSLFWPVRWVLRLGGYSGDKKEGIKHMQIVAERGCLLAPFAKLMLAIAYLRSGQPADARELLAELQREFPSNPLFERELKRLDGGQD